MKIFNTFKQCSELFNQYYTDGRFYYRPTAIHRCGDNYIMDCEALEINEKSLKVSQNNSFAYYSHKQLVSKRIYNSQRKSIIDKYNKANKIFNENDSFLKKYLKHSHDIKDVLSFSKCDISYYARLLHNPDTSYVLRIYKFSLLNDGNYIGNMNEVILLKDNILKEYEVSVNAYINIKFPTDIITNPNLISEDEYITLMNIVTKITKIIL